MNLYAYCINNPIMNSDPSGNFAITIGLIIWHATTYLIPECKDWHYSRLEKNDEYVFLDNYRLYD